MGEHKSVWQRFREYSKEEFDPRDPRNRLRGIFTIAAIIIGIGVFAGGVAGWEYAGTPKFCGTFCHSDVPQYTAYQDSPHARVQCIACHVGTGFATALENKVGDLGHVMNYIVGYEKPKHIKNLRPIRGSCEECHWPEQFQGDSIRVVQRFAEDEKNTTSSIYLVMKTGGGPVRQGRGTSIHWHVNETVRYVATDSLRQKIPWVQVVKADGSTVEYIESGSNFDISRIDPESINTVQCADCHNRAAHDFYSPNAALDLALGVGQIDSTIPFIKRQALAALSKAYATPEEARSGVTRELENYYRTNQAAYYGQNAAKVTAAIQQTVALWNRNNFPDLKVDGTVYPDNNQHLEFPGCFRCHDGKHKSAGNEYIRLECNVCHSVPVVQQVGEPIPSIPVLTQPEPPSHLTTTWIAEHRVKVDQSCSACHQPTFCSNQACHGIKYKFIGLEAGPGGGQLPSAPSPTPSARPAATVAPPAPTPIPTSAPASASPAAATPPPSGAGPTATPTRAPAAAPTATPVPAAAVAKPIPHATAGMDQCLLCHEAGIGGATKVPPGHTGRTNQTCQGCHKPK